MNIHEYQGKKLLAEYGVSVPKGRVAFNPEDAVKAAEELGGDTFVVKAQIHAGGRGAGTFKNEPDGKGGVRVVKTIQEVHENASKMLGNILITKQTGEIGKEVKRIYVEQGCEIARELYLGMLLDRQTSRLTMMASTEGGVEIEEVAKLNPEKIHKISIDPITGIQPHHIRKLAFSLGLKGTEISVATKFMNGIYMAFLERDCSIVEINPMVITKSGEILALDVKINFDDNALFRQSAIMDLRDEDEEDPAELEAAKHDLNYIKLDGNIGCMVNGAGLAMGTMDIIKLYGGDPANFLDVGGGATKERVATAFKIILSDSNVKGILVNIFGGIMRCDVIAEGIVEAAREVSIGVPLVVRLEGTNVKKGIEILSGSGLPIITGEDLADGAKKVVAAVKGEL